MVEVPGSVTLRSYSRHMEIVVIVGVASGVAGFFFNAWLERQKRQREIAAQVGSVTVDIEDVRSNVTDYSWQQHGQQIIVRNDGAAAVNITHAALAYGDRWATTDRPRFWSFDFVPPGRFERHLLPPTESLILEAPDYRMGASMLGPVITLTDASGRTWQRTIWGYRLLNKWDRPVRRRYLWFEQQSWFRALDAWCWNSMARKLTRRPRRLPWELRIIDWLWGYRAGGRDNLRNLPWNSPVSWEWSNLLPPEGWEPPSRRWLIRGRRPQLPPADGQAPESAAA